MRWKISAGVLAALILLVPAAPATAQTGQRAPDASCQTVERKVFKDVRKLITIDLDTATDVQVRVLANQILSTAMAESLHGLPDAIQQRLDGTPDDLRAFLKTGVLDVWSTDLEVSVTQTLTGAGPNVRAAAQKALDARSIDGFLAYLNEGLYAARALDCAAQPSPTPSVTPSATPGATTTAAPVPSSSAGPGTAAGEGGGLAVTGTDTATVAGIGGALLLLGGAGYLVGRRRRSRFVA